eukprot:maker-scaffold220_size252247-snap-gene-0.12 protein:Tk01509 transcript:maker-scaffold220_size252247-snap-gene-0.12-mRNA-1 annotation:"mevalonate kinase"
MKKVAMTTKDILVTSPGKVILHGEHSVVYDKLALAVCINLRTKVHIRALPAQPGNLTIHFPNLGTSYSFPLKALASLRPVKSPCLLRSTFADIWREFSPLVPKLKAFVASLYPNRNDDQGIVAFLFLLLVQSWNILEPMEVTVSSEIPIGAGLGSSAAYSVAVAGALHRLKSRNKVVKVLTPDNNNLSPDIHSLKEDMSSLQAASKKTNGGKKQKLESRIQPKAKLTQVSSDQFSSNAQEEICQWAFMAEKILHGNPSGIDNCVCTYGGLLSYQSSIGKTPLKAPENLRILLINTRVSRNTKALVERVRCKAFEYPKVTSCILDAIDTVSHHCLDTLTQIRKISEEAEAHRRIESGYGSENSGMSSNESSEESDHSNDDEQDQLYRKLEELIDTNQGLLSALGVSHPTLDQIQAIAAKQGLHAKLTGAGGGGFAFALITPRHTPVQVKTVRTEMELNGFDCWETIIGGSGVQFHATD